MTVDEIVAAARECLGTPFHHQGRVLGYGLDCAGVAAHVARAVGCEVVEVSGYGRTPAHGQIEQALEAQPYLMRIAESPRPGDLLLMRFISDPQHLAIYTDDDTIVHAYEAVGRCVEHRLDSRWRARLVDVYRFRDLA